MAAFDEWIARIKSRDPMVYEDAFHEQWPHGPEFIARLIVEMRLADDSYTRGKLIELLGEAGDQTVVPELARELEHPDWNIRQWALHALRRIGGREASKFIEQHRLQLPKDLD